MLKNLKSLSLAAVAAAAVLVPLYGDPRSAPVTHAEWARMLLRALELEDVTPPGAQASQAFSTLSWKSSLAYSADRYLKGEGVRITGEAGHRRVVATGATGEVTYALGVVRGGDYRLRVKIAGNPEAPASAEITALGDERPRKTFTIVPASVPGWIEAGTSHLDPGPYTASLVLPAGTALEHVEMAPPCVGPVEPVGGWAALKVLDRDDLAVTAVKAMDLESELPPADADIELSGSDFRVAGGAILSAAARGPGFDGMALRAGAAGLQAMVFVNIPEAGLYTLSSFGIEGSGQSWLVDSCARAVLCETRREVTTGAVPEWRDIMTTSFAAGPHFLTVTLGNGAVVERVRVQRKKDTAADYVATLKRLGFDPGAGGPVARNRAVDAMNFVKGRRKVVKSEPCDLLLQTNPTRLVSAEPAEPIGPAPTPGTTGTIEPALAPPAIPPQVPASPILPGP